MRVSDSSPVAGSVSVTFFEENPKIRIAFSPLRTCRPRDCHLRNPATCEASGRWAAISRMFRRKDAE